MIFGLLIAGDGAGDGGGNRKVVASSDDKDALLNIDATGLHCECTSQQQ